MSTQHLATLSELSKGVLAEKLDLMINHEKKRIVTVTRTSPFRRVTSQKLYVEDMVVADYLVVFEEDDD